MKSDLQFLQNSTMSKGIKRNNSSIDHISINCAPFPNKNNYNHKTTISISDKYKRLIKKRKYLLLKEPTINNIKNEIEIYYYNNIQNNNRYNDYINYNNYVKYTKNKNKSCICGNLKYTNENIYIGNSNRSKHINDLNKIYHENYNNLFEYQKKKNYIFEEDNFKNRINKNKNNKNNKKNILIQNKIKIEREEFVPLINNKSINNLNKSQKEYIYLNNTYDHIEKPIIKKNNFKNNNKNYEEEIKRINSLLNEEEKKRKDAEKNNDILQIKIKEISERSKEYQNELHKMQKKRNIKEDELNDKIMKLEQENEELKQKLSLSK